MRYLFDTNIVIYYFNGLTADESLHELLTERFKISIITKIEFLGWSEFAANPELFSQAQAFIRHAGVYELTDDIAKQTIQLRKVQDQDARCHYRRDGARQRSDCRHPQHR